MGFIGDAVGGVFGLGEGQRQGQGTMEELDRLYQDLPLTDFGDLESRLDGLIKSGQIDPVQAQSILQERSGMGDVTVDPRLRSAQMAALGELEGIGKAGGLRLSDKAQLQEIGMDEAARARGSREALAQNARMRGLGGSGLSLTSQLMNDQGAASRAAQRGSQVAGQAQDRALQALMGAGNMAGGMRGQQFQEEASKAKAQDEINRFNASMKNQTQDANLARRERAQYGNRDYRTNMEKQRAGYRTGATDENFMKAAGRAGAMQGIAGMQADAGRSRDEFMGGLLESGEKMGSMAAMGMFSDVNLKENIQPGEGDIQQFLDNLTVNEFEYKDPAMGEGKHFGPMAQDLEKSPVGASMVEDTPQGKMIDYGKGQGVMLSILKNLSDRLEAVGA